MSEEDRRRWDDRYEKSSLAAPDGPLEPPRAFRSAVDFFPTEGVAIDVACGLGAGSLWLADRGFTVTAVDASGVAIARARAYALACDRARGSALASRITFVRADLDDGLPATPPVDLVLCHLFRDPRLDDALVDRLRPGGVLALAALSEVGHGPGRFRVTAGELRSTFSERTDVEILAGDEADGVAWIIARRALPQD